MKAILDQTTLVLRNNSNFYNFNVLYKLTA